MAFWGNDAWEAANHAREIVEAFDKGRISDGAYKLSIGNEAIVSSEYDQKSGAYRTLQSGDTLSLEPGQFAYLITKERINLPNRTIGFINVNTGTKIKGLINISGFHVDPGYHGKLIFTVFNASPQTITLYEGQPIFRLWLSDFDGVGGESDTSYDSLPKELVDRLYGTYPSPFALASRINAIENRLEDLKAQRSQLLLGLFLIGFLLLPFVVNLYSSLLAPWFSDESKVSMDASKQRAAPTAVIPAPAASTPSTGATPGVSEPPKP